MRILMTSIAAMAIGLTASPAFAQDSDPHPFDGFYIGGSVGAAVQPNDNNSSILFDRDLNGSFGDIVSVNVTGQNAFGPNTTGGAFNGGFCGGDAAGNNSGAGCVNDHDAVEYYGRLGFDTHFRGVVVGLMGEFGRPEIRDSVTAFSTTPASYTFTRKLDYAASVRGRIGFTPMPNRTTLFYATGGGAYGKVKSNFRTTNAVNSFSPSGKSNAYGYSVGGGVEQKIGRNFSVGLEYIYTDLEDDNARVRVGALTSPATPTTNPFLLAGAGGTDFRRSDDHLRWHSMRFTAAFRF